MWNHDFFSTNARSISNKRRPKPVLLLFPNFFYSTENTKFVMSASVYILFKNRRGVKCFGYQKNWGFIRYEKSAQILLHFCFFFAHQKSWQASCQTWKKLGLNIFMVYEKIAYIELRTDNLVRILFFVISH
jgi:hypothetical protein